MGTQIRVLLTKSLGRFHVVVSGSIVGIRHMGMNSRQKLHVGFCWAAVSREVSPCARGETSTWVGV